MAASCSQIELPLETDLCETQARTNASKNQEMRKKKKKKRNLQMHIKNWKSSKTTPVDQEYFARILFSNNSDEATSVLN